MTGAAVRDAQNTPEFWMVIATAAGVQAPYNFKNQDTAERFLRSLTNDPKTDGVQLLRMRDQRPQEVRLQNPIPYHSKNQTLPIDGIARPPSKGKRVQPNLLRDADWNAEILKIPGLEWAGHGSQGDSHRYEFIGHIDPLIALGCVEPHMLDVGVSGLKRGQGYNTQALTNNRFRLELHLEQTIDVAGLDPVKAGASKSRRSVIDPVSSSLKKTSMLVRKYPRRFHADLYKRICEAKGNGWQLLESFPWLAVRIFVFDDRSARHACSLVRQGAKTREIAEVVNVSMCFKRFVSKATERLLKVHDLLSQHTDVVSHHCPKGATDQSSWLSYIRKARSSGSAEFAIWVAVHWDVFCKESERRDTLSRICDLRDWVRACTVQRVGSVGIDSICQLLDDNDLTADIEKRWQNYSDLAEAGKPFNKEMSPQTVIKLSEEWHDRQAEKEAADVEFPQEWFEGGTVGTFRIEPVRTAPELSRYAYRLHNCATQYAHQIADKNCFFYVVFEGDELKAMIEISNSERGITMSQLKGPRNSEVSTELKVAVDSWRKTCKAPEKSQPVEVSEAL